MGYSSIANNAKDAQMAAHMAEEFIDPNADMKIISICETINFELKESTNVWVQPHEDHVVVRFLFVYTHGFGTGHGAKLDDPIKKRILDEALVMTEL